MMTREWVTVHIIGFVRRETISLTREELLAARASLSHIDVGGRTAGLGPLIRAIDEALANTGERR